jgi:hypothetical protein
MTGHLGPRGLAVLALAGIAGVLLAILGWSQRGTGLIAPSVGGLGGSASGRTATAPPATSATPANRAATPSPSVTQATTPAAQPGATASIGPLLSAEPYASFAFLVWPGTVSTGARQAMSGLTITVSRQTGGISIVAGVTGRQLPPAHFYPTGAKVYVLESNLSDDGGGVDINLGDDGLVVTNAQGRIVGP